MLAVRWLNPADSEDFVFLGELIARGGDALFDQATDDPILTVCALEQALKHGKAVAAIAMLRGERVGALWADARPHEVFTVYGGMLSGVWDGLRSPALTFARTFCAMLFQELGAHKLSAEVACWNRPSERLLRKIGFKKEGIAKEVVERHGRREDAVLLALLARDFEAKNG